MMTNLFSVFDLSLSILTLQLNLLSALLGLLFIQSSMWLIPSDSNIILPTAMNTLHKEFNMLLNKPKMNIMFCALLIFIMMNNFLGLTPYIFTATSHMLITLSLALPLWVSLMLFGWIKNTSHMFTHFVPQGMPPLFMSFMVCIETISNVICPGTLAVQLAANMIAGHLLLTHLSSQGPGLLSSLLPILVITQILLLMLKSAMAIIQSYVFTVLSILYTSEV